MTSISSIPLRELASSLAAKNLWIPFFLASKTIGRQFPTPLILPFNPNSPIMQISSNLLASIKFRHPKKATAIGKSNAVPFFLILAGDKLTVIFMDGRGWPMERSADATLSFASMDSLER